MRKIILSIFTLMSAVSLSYGQGVTDATHFGDNGIMGTARYMGMAGSFGALGGDPSAIIDNPAGLGIYRGSELSFTLNPTIINTTTGKNGQYGKANDFFFNFNQAALVLAFPSGREKGYVSSNFSFTYNRLKDFHRSVEYMNNTPSGSLSGYLAGFTNGFNPSSLVEEKLAPLYSKLGADNTQITFDNNGNFTLSVKGKEVKGTVADNGDGSFSLKLGSDKSLTVYFQKSATDLAIAADATKLVNLVEKLASISDKATLNTVASLLEKYDQICIGLRMKK